MKTRGSAASEAALADDEIDLRELLLRIWRRRWFIALVTTALVVMAVLHLTSATYSYTVKLKVAPIGGEGGNGLAGLAKTAGALGLQVPSSGEVSNLDLYLAMLKSQEVAERLVTSQDLMLTIFANEWDEQAQDWREPEAGLKARVARTVKEWLGLPQLGWEPPSSRRLLSYLEQAVLVNQPSSTPILTVSVDHPDPVFAEKLLMRLHNAADAILRERTLARTGKHIDYLHGLLQRTRATEYRTALVDALTSQEKLRMAAMADVPFSVEVVSGPVVSAGPTSPRPRQMLLLAVVLGFMSSSFLALIWGDPRTLRAIGISRSDREQM